MKGTYKNYYDLFVNTCGKYPRNIGVRHYIDFHYKLYTYSELYGACEYIAQTLYCLQIQRTTVGILSDRNPFIPCLIAAIHKSSPTFIFLDPASDYSELINKLEIGALIAVNSPDGIQPDTRDLVPKKEIKIYDFEFKFFKLDDQASSISCKCSEDESNKEHSYIVVTSGSTGEPKHVQVPIKCLEPNISDLISMFELNSSDVIYFSTPLTFDPSMVEILLACSTGASLLIAPGDIDIIFSYCEGPENCVTFWQTTPSKFFQLSDGEIAHVLSAESNLKILALGGEPINNVKRLKEFKSKDNKTRIYCIYGVTEMSCWATTAELQLDKINDDKEIPLGQCMSETRLELTQIKQNVGKILLGSDTRKCRILNKQTSNIKVDSSGTAWVETGDLGSVMEGTIYFRGRMDDIVKRFGNKVNLKNIEKIVMTIPDVKSCSCVWLMKPQILVLYYASEELECAQMKKKLYEKLNAIQKPDKIIRIGSMPLNRHGKIDKMALTESSLSNKEGTDVVQLFKDTIVRSLPKSVDYEEICDKNFMAVGGNSFMAITICNYVSMCFPYLGNCVLPLLLSHTEKIQNIVDKLRLEHKSQIRKSKRKSTSSMKLIKEEQKKKRRIPKTEPTSSLKWLWSYDTGKCVDATPSYFEESEEGFITVGSHSGQIVVLKATSGALVGSINLGSRIEAAILCIVGPKTKACGLVGTYDGTVICFDLKDCKDIWTTKVPAMIKSKAAVANNQAYVASYDGIVRSFDIKTGVVLKSYVVSKLGISADLVESKGCVVVGTLVGVVACIDTNRHVIKWRTALESPVFSSPVCFDDNLLVAEVAGVIHCFNINTAEIVWKFIDAYGSNIFSSFIVNRKKPNLTEIMFGCHDNHLYCIHHKSTTNRVSLKWKVQLSGQVYSTPSYINNRSHVVAASSCGKLYIINCDSSKILCEHELPNKVFSSPTVADSLIFVGCRNDMVYCFNHLPSLEQ